VLKHIGSLQFKTGILSFDQDESRTMALLLQLLVLAAELASAAGAGAVTAAGWVSPTPVLTTGTDGSACLNSPAAVPTGADCPASANAECTRARSTFNANERHGVVSTSFTFATCKQQYVLRVLVLVVLLLWCSWFILLLRCNAGLSITPDDLPREKMQFVLCIDGGRYYAGVGLDWATIVPLGAKKDGDQAEITYNRATGIALFLVNGKQIKLMHQPLPLDTQFWSQVNTWSCCCCCCCCCCAAAVLLLWYC